MSAWRQKLQDCRDADDRIEGSKITESFALSKARTGAVNRGTDRTLYRGRKITERSIDGRDKIDR